MINYLKLDIDKVEEAAKVLKEAGFNVAPVRSLYEEFLIDEVQDYLELNSDNLNEAYAKHSGNLSIEEYEKALTKCMVFDLRHNEYFQDSIYDKIGEKFWETIKNPEEIQTYVE